MKTRIYAAPAVEGLKCSIKKLEWSQLVSRYRDPQLQMSIHTYICTIGIKIYANFANLIQISLKEIFFFEGQMLKTAIGAISTLTLTARGIDFN